MADCVVCGVSVSVSDACTHCASPVCNDHRAPEAHDCPGVDGDATDSWYTQPDNPSRGGDGEAQLLSTPRRLAIGVTIVLLLAATLAGALAVAGTSEREVNESRVAGLIAEGVNEERAARGLDRLAYDGELARLAENHSQDMATRGYFDHESPEGVGLAERYRRAGIDCPGGENIYTLPHGELQISDRALADRVVREWLRSPGHRETMLKSRFDRQGIGVAVGPDGRVYVTQDLC